MNLKGDSFSLINIYHNNEKFGQICASNLFIHTSKIKIVSVVFKNSAYKSCLWIKYIDITHTRTLFKI